MNTNLVLRTVYLPMALDDKLRYRSFHTGKSVSALIREAVEISVKEWSKK